MAYITTSRGGDEERPLPSEHAAHLAHHDPNASEATLRAVLRDLLAASELHERALFAVELASEQCLTLDEYNARVDALRAADDALHRAQDAARAAVGGGGVMRYVYRGDRLTDPALVGQPCEPVRRVDGRCIVGRHLGSQLVRFADGRVVVVLRRRLRLAAHPEGGQDG